jgi:hypothetical protein
MGRGFDERFVTVLGYRTRGNEAPVWLGTSDRPSVEEHERVLVR